MAWIHYPLRFRLLSPLHVGHRRVGNLMQTRPYVPGKVIWAALTARLTRELHSNPQRKHYKDIGDRLQEHFRFGYLWPSLDGETPYFWWEHEDFEYVFLGSYVSTALDYGRGAAEEGSLHETEFLAPYTRDEGLPVFLVGDLWVREDSLPDNLKHWREALERVQLGGERVYGWGRVRLIISQKEKSGQGSTVTGLRWQEQDGEVAIVVPAGRRLLAHALAESLLRDDVSGPIDLLSGWERDNDDPKRIWRLSRVKIAYAPDAKAKRELRLKLNPWGVLCRDAT